MKVTSSGRHRTLTSLFFIGLGLWVAGALDLFGTLLSAWALITGSLLAVTAAYVLLNTPPSGRRAQSRAGEAAFCFTFAVGLAAIGFAISPVTAWFSPAVIFLIGGLFLIAWSPQAFPHRRIPGD